MANDVFQIEWEGIDQLVRILQQMDDRKNAILKEEYTRFGLLVEEGAKALAPHDKGDLTDSIHADPAKIAGEEISVEVSVNSQYGVYQHELVGRPGSHAKYENGAKFPNYYKDGRGARTRSKSGWRGQQAGRKFLERASTLVEPDFDEMNQRAMDRITEQWGNG